jgi:DNA-directed RNA polymerase alpha subunit
MPNRGIGEAYKNDEMEFYEKAEDLLKELEEKLGREIKPIVIKDPDANALYLSTRTKNILKRNGIGADDLLEKTEPELLELDGAGYKAVKEIKRYLGEYGHTLKYNKL